MSGNFANKSLQGVPMGMGDHCYTQFHHDVDGSSSSAEGKPEFPFLMTPSGNLKVIPQQVVYESKQLSIVAADPKRTKVNVKADGQIRARDMSGTDKRMFNETIRPSPQGLQVRSQPDGDQPNNMDEPPTMAHRRQAAGGKPLCTIVQLQKEINLKKMGLHKANPIDWNKVQLPPKTDLHKLIHYRISHYINPDILVKIGNHEYRCHLLVLQCYSRYFVDNSASRIELPEENVSKNAFTYIYDWMLHLGGDSYIFLRRDNILEIFMAAQYLQVKELEEQCWAFIDNEDLFSEDKAFLLYLDARDLGNTTVMELMVPRVQKFFLTLVASKDFLDLNVVEVGIFLRSNSICVHCEMEVFMSAVRWLVHDWDKRQKHVAEVMYCVRFGLISPWQLVDIRRNPENQEFLLVTQHAAVSSMIEDGLAYAIVRHWYGRESEDYTNWIETLGLTVPSPRNWSDTHKLSEQKKYNTYQEFLADLSKYRQMQIMTNRGAGDRESVVSSTDSLQAELDHSNYHKPASPGLAVTPQDYIMPRPR